MVDDFETFRDPTLSMFQSLVSEVATQIDARPSVSRTPARSASSSLRETAIRIARRETGQETTDGGVVVQRSLTTGETATVCAELALRYIKALAIGDSEALATVQDEYQGSTCDSAWASTLKAYHSYFGIAGGRKTIPYVRAADVGSKIVPMRADATLALVADWGTGARPALDILSDLTLRDPDILIHLGDVYYSGTPKEFEESFTTPVERIFRADRNRAVYTLSGNHDMYCGGLGYYDAISKLNESPFTQPASFFCLRSQDEKWQFLALDTGLHDHSPYGVADVTTKIEDDELEWLCERMREFKGRTILLSHHQLFSAFSRIGPVSPGGKLSSVNPNLLRAFQKIASEGDVAAWFWGHEHSLSIYEPFAGLQRGRCIGHGAIPVPNIEKIYEPLPGLTELPKLVHGTELGMSGGVYNHGYVKLSLSGDNCKAEYVELQGGKARTVYSEVF